ncbi:uncharacterized protein EV422DRAFT_157984 [Fimicolochytrium jonesii]|uniref:uncharacterized protein n=1 Tax=Fimicolochytrium jonesii TaxID=1396493 RepID=UPI0022FEB932|nr:uncharacterized protein EV422DRAFT_157984 [Fimicolochytrium jonesii]KAI8826209.1 hypothetical protein EV422DRAFT_157984 [Fimicolochytrium jonesii]
MTGLWLASLASFAKAFALVVFAPLASPSQINLKHPCTSFLSPHATVLPIVSPRWETHLFTQKRIVPRQLFPNQPFVERSLHRESRPLILRSRPRNRIVAVVGLSDSLRQLVLYALNASLLVEALGEEDGGDSQCRGCEGDCCERVGG